MIEWIIRRSVANRFLVMMGALFLSIWGTWTIINTPVDALPDLSGCTGHYQNQPSRPAPQIVENQSPIHLPPPCCPYLAQNRAWFFTVRGFVCVCHF